MSKPEDIPEDIWNAADEAWNGLANSVIATRYDETAIIARALMAERERCAALVDAECKRVLSLQDGRMAEVDRNLRMIAVLLPDIAAAIRNGDQP